MNDPINFEIESLAARYELHPDRQDVFVEGVSDVGLLRAFLADQGLNAVSVFPIDVVNVAEEKVLGRDLPHPNKRSEVITLAHELVAYGVSSRQAVCIADSDLEKLFAQQNLHCSLLLLTDYSSMEMYGFSEAVVQRVLTIVSPDSGFSGAQLLHSLAPTLTFLFAARSANVKLNRGLVWIENLHRFCKIVRGKFLFDSGEFLRRYALVRLDTDARSQFVAKLEEINTMHCVDMRFKMRGHDFVYLLVWFLRTSEKSNHLTEEAVYQMLYISIRPTDISGEHLFIELVKRLRQKR
jgi:hypothetical protein